MSGYTLLRYDGPQGERANGGTAIGTNNKITHRNITPRFRNNMPEHNITTIYLQWRPITIATIYVGPRALIPSSLFTYIDIAYI